MDINALIQLDKQWLLTLNGSDSLFIDSLATVLTTASTWIPLYVALFYMVIRNNENVRQVMLVVAGALLCVVLAGTVDDSLVKPMVARWRPSHDPQIGILVDVVNDYRGGKYGFFSAHAANTFSLAIYFSLIVRDHLFTVAMVCWSLINCWTRMYLGVHFPVDIICGLLWGGFVGCLLAYAYSRMRRWLGWKLNFISTQYTSTGYLLSDIHVVLCVLSLTMAYVLVRTCVLTFAE